jgi:polar amino acid transport system substrate-binding protein
MSLSLLSRVIAKLPLMIVLLCGLPCTSFAIDLKTAAQESSPKYHILENGEMGGICVEIIQAIERVDPEIHFYGYQNFLPFKRLQKYLENGQLDIFVGLKETEERKEKYTFLDFPLYELNYVMVVRKEDDVEIDSFEDVLLLGKKEEILTVSGSAAGRFLHEQGVILVDDSAKSPTILLQMLVAERGQFVFYHDLGIQDAIRKEGLEQKVKMLAFSFATYSHSAAFSINTPVRIIEKVRVALDKLEKGGDLANIRRKYNLLNK